jgi:ABC-type branched-subunit amino acid transport system substrate-binding protein/cytochrome c553
MHFPRLNLSAIVLAFFLFTALAVTTIAFAQNPAAQTGTDSAAETRPLTPAERRGRALYLRGESASKREITAIVNDLDVPATTVTCAGCHGRRGEGKSEGGVTAGNLTWSNLVKPYGHTHPTGRKHGPFTESSFATAVVRGVDPAGNDLVVAMPRYHMSIEDMNDLIAYIKRLEFDRDPGVTAEGIDVGVPLPTATALAETGQSIRQALTAYFDELNSHGGIYNRKIKLHFTDAATTDVSGGLRALTTQNQVFAFIAGISAGADKQLAAFAREEEIPFVGPATLLPQLEHPPNRYVFYLLPGVSEQAVALVNYADQQLGIKKQHVALLVPNGELASAASDAVIAHAKQVGWTDVVKVSYAADKFDAAQIAQQLKTDNTAAVFVLGAGTDIDNFVKAADALQWTPYVLSLGVMTSQGLAANLPATFSKKIFLAFPTVPADVSAEGVAEYRSLAEKYKLPSRHAAAQLAALAAAKTFVEGLKRAGADLSREQLITALEGLYDYDTGLTPKLIFGPNRRVGASGAYVITINTETKEFVSTGGWISAGSN